MTCGLPFKPPLWEEHILARYVSATVACSELWAAVKDTLGNPQNNYEVKESDDSAMHAEYDEALPRAQLKDFHPMSRKYGNMPM